MALMAQEATPEDSEAIGVLRYLLADVIEGGDYTGLPAIAEVDVNTLIENMADVHGYAARGVDVQMVAGDGQQAMAYAIITDTSGQDYDLFLHVVVTGAGLLRSYRWCTSWRD